MPGYPPVRIALNLQTLDNLVRNMADHDLIRTLDLCDSYVESNQRLALTLKHCFFSLAQIRYSAGHGTVSPCFVSHINTSFQA